jgi:hypothetical protein
MADFNAIPNIDQEHSTTKDYSAELSLPTFLGFEKLHNGDI